MAKQYKISVATKIFWGFLILIVSLNVAIQITGNSYMYKALVYTYADIDDLDIFDSRKISNDTARTQPWPQASDYNKRKLPGKLQSTLTKYQTVEFVIIHNDSISYEQYADHYDTNSLSNSFSMAKSVVGVLVGIATDEGKIKSIDDPVVRYLDWFKNKDLTIRELLTMSAALNWDEKYSSLFSVTTKAYYGSNLEKLARSLHPVGPTGKIFNYQSGCTVLLALILEKATGKSVSEFASEALWKPLGAEFPAQWSLDYAQGHEKAFCCIYSTARDFARIGQLYLDSGRWHGYQVVSEKWVKESVTPAPLQDGDEGGPNKVYGFQWWISQYKQYKIFYCRGLNGQYIVVVPDKRLIMVRLGRKRGGPLPGHHLEDLDIYIDEVMKMYGA